MPTSVRLSAETEKRLEAYLDRNRKHGVQAALVEEAILRFLDAEERGALAGEPNPLDELFLLPLYPDRPHPLDLERVTRLDLDPHDRRIVQVTRNDGSPRAQRTVELRTNPRERLAYRVRGLHYEPLGFHRGDTTYLSSSERDPHPLAFRVYGAGLPNLLPGDAAAGLSLNNWSASSRLPVWGSIPLREQPIVRYPSCIKALVGPSFELLPGEASYFRLYLVCSLP